MRLDRISAIVRTATGAQQVTRVEELQELWSGYGSIARCHLEGAAAPSVVVKHVRYPTRGRRARDDEDRSHARKLKSYQVETAWYRDWSRSCGAGCRVPACLALEAAGDEVVMVLEDLNAAGFPSRRGRVEGEAMEAGLTWLAHFHATHLGAEPRGLWEVGTYWHLATRPDELRALADRALAEAAPALDRALRGTGFRTLVHGDAKLANFCFSRDGRRAAAVDFQYVGGGCGMQDLAYYVGSCFDDREAERQEERLLDAYFARLREALRERRSTVDADALETDWRALYRVAWTDFHRFYKGWAGGRYAADSYSERVAREVMAELGGRAGRGR